jgi:hypothetical protein
MNFLLLFYLLFMLHLLLCLLYDILFYWIDDKAYLLTIAL